MPSIDIDRDAAHQAAQHELDKPIYPKPSLSTAFSDWLNEQLYRLLERGASVSGGWFTLTVLFILAVIAVIVAVHIARRTMRTNRGGDYQLFEAGQLTAAQHRATAEAFAAQGNWAAAIRHRLRAVARELEETGVLNPAPDAPPTSWPPTRARPCLTWQANWPGPQRPSTTSPTASGPELKIPTS
ncbi:hypothetical protein I546_5991 [Mycobacterium kansasii 732]|nr:hypothetical protein I546_5991 [Mycobacterium kansasii 732]